MNQAERAKAIGGGERPSFEDDSMRTWLCGCYEDQGGYHLCATHAVGGGPRVRPPQEQAIQARLDKRREPAIGTCNSCGHQQEITRGWQVMAHGMTAEAWICQRCRGQMSVTVMMTSNEPGPDEDIAELLAQLAECQGARDALQEAFDDLKYKAYADYAEAKGRAEAAEADLSAWRSRGQALVAQLREEATRSHQHHHMGYPGDVRTVYEHAEFSREKMLAFADALAALLRAPQLTTMEEDTTKNDEKNLARGDTPDGA